MSIETACPVCSSAITVNLNVPAPHHGRKVCANGHFLGWVAAPITRERLEAFRMPYGIHSGKPFEAIDQSYIEWLSLNAKPSIRRLAAAYLEWQAQP